MGNVADKILMNLTQAHRKMHKDPCVLGCSRVMTIPASTAQAPVPC